MFRFIRNMNKKALISIAFAVVIFLSGFGYIVINNLLNAFQPVDMNLSALQRQTVSGNGGQAVIVGDAHHAYVYFIGNFVETATIEHRQNEHNRVTHGAIFRARLTNNALKYYDADRALQEGIARNQLAGKQMIVPKIAGHERSALFVFDRYLVYTSPNNTRNRYGQLQTDRLDFFRVDLDGRNHRLIYTADNPNLRLDDFTVTSHGGQVFLLIMDGENLRRVRVAGGNVGQVRLISNNVHTFALPVVTAYSHANSTNPLTASFSGVMRYVYFTENQTAEEVSRHGPGNVLKKYDIFHGTTTELWRGREHRISVLSLSNRRLMYTIEDLRVDTGPAVFMTRPDMVQSTGRYPFAVAGNINRDNFRVLAEGTPMMEFRMSTEANINDGQNSTFVGFGNGSLFLFNRVGGNPTGAPRIIHGVRDIIGITSTTVYFIHGTGEIGFVCLSGEEPDCNHQYEDGEECNKEVMMLGEHSWRPTSLTRLSLFRLGTYTRIFFIDVLESGEYSRNFAMIGEFGGNVNQVREAVLAHVDARYLNT